MPGFIGLPDQLGERHSVTFVLQISHEPPFIEQGHEAMDIGMLGYQAPVKPVEFAVMTVGVIIAVLCAPHFVAHQNHGSSN